MTDHLGGLIITLLRTAVATSSSYFFGSKKGICSSGLCGTPLWLNKSGKRIASDMIFWISRLSFRCFTSGHSWSHTGRSAKGKFPVTLNWWPINALDFLCEWIRRGWKSAAVLFDCCEQRRRPRRVFFALAVISASGVCNCKTVIFYCSLAICGH